MIEESKLAQALRHVAEGKRIVDRQRELIANHKSAGRDTAAAEQLLELFERTLAVFEADLKAIQKAS